MVDVIVAVWVRVADAVVVEVAVGDTEPSGVRAGEPVGVAVAVAVEVAVAVAAIVDDGVLVGVGELLEAPPSPASR